MRISKNFTGWAIDRAEAIVADQGFDIIHSATDHAPTKDQRIVRLTLAIIEALVDAHNFGRDSEKPDRGLHS
jgi:2-keto-3-deoxy-L-rhamnonate aldolase RhmA